MVHASDMHYHQELIEKLVRATSAKVVLELGVRAIVSHPRKGTSTFFFWKSLAPEEGKLYSVDLKNPASHNHSEEFLLRELRSSGRWEFIQGNTMNVFEDIEARFRKENISVDILFIDTDKEGDLTKYELENYSKLLGPKGIIMMHDTGWVPSKRVHELARANSGWPAHDSAVQDFLQQTDFKMKAQLGSYNMVVLYRDVADLCGVKIDNDLPVDENRAPYEDSKVALRRRKFNEIWSKYE